MQKKVGHRAGDCESQSSWNVAYPILTATHICWHCLHRSLVTQHNHKLPTNLSEKMTKRQSSWWLYCQRICESPFLDSTSSLWILSSGLLWPLNPFKKVPVGGLSPGWLMAAPWADSSTLNYPQSPWRVNAERMRHALYCHLLLLRNITDRTIKTHSLCLFSPCFITNPFLGENSTLEKDWY